MRSAFGAGEDTVWDEMVKEVDVNGDGVIDLEEFITLLTNKI